MKLLALETSSTACSVALSVDNEITGEHVVEPRAHTRILMPMIDRLLQNAGLRPAELDAVVLGNGPGSFIGMRIGASVAQGICFAADIGLIPLSSLAAIAAEVFAEHDADRVIVAQDARMSEVYVGIYDRGPDNLPQPVGEEYIAATADPGFGDRPFAAAGGGWTRYPALREGINRPVRVYERCAEPNAEFLLRIACSSRVQPVAPASLEPAYLRHRVADVPAAQQ